MDAERNIVPYAEIAIIKGKEVRVIFHRKRMPSRCSMRLRRVLILPQWTMAQRDDLTPERVFNTPEFGRKVPPPSGFVTFKPCEAEKDIKFDCKFPEDDNCIQPLKIAAMCGIFMSKVEVLTIHKYINHIRSVLKSDNMEAARPSIPSRDVLGYMWATSGGEE